MDPNPVPTQTKTSPSNSISFTLPLIIGLLALGIGGFIGYTAGKKTITPLPQTPAPKISVAERLLSEPQKTWGKLVDKSYGEFTVTGKVLEVKNGLGPVNSQAQTDGQFVTLKNGDNQAKFFVSQYSDWYEGKIGDFISWKKQDNPFTISVGDTLYLQIHALAQENSTIDSFYSWWVFRQKE